MANFTKSYKANVGLNHVPAYQASGRPYASGSIVSKNDAINVIAKLEFPNVTRWIYVTNHGADAVRVGFSELGVVSGSNYFRIAGVAANGNSAPQSIRLEVKVSELYLSGSTSVDVVAGLTTIPAHRTSGSTGPSWSGSAGVG